MPTTLRFAGAPIGTSFAASVQVGGTTATETVPAFLDPAAVSGLPRLSDAFEGGTMSVDITGLTSVTNYDFRIAGGASQQNGATATFDTTGQGGNWIECVVTHSGGTSTSPAVMVYATGHHDSMDAGIMSLMGHAEATHIAVADGDWTAPGTWQNNKIPRNGAKVLIPHGRTITYDSNSPYTRLDRVRVDGTLTWATDQNTAMLVDTLLGTRGSSTRIGTDGNPIGAAYTADIIISGRDCAQKGYDDTDLNTTRDAALWSRGAVFLGNLQVEGQDSYLWGFAQPIDQGATSLTLFDTPTGWQVGDDIIIGGTKASWSNDGTETANIFNKEDETVTITGISGKVISWTGGLTYPHKNQLAGSNRTDLYPVILRKGGKNVRFSSEVPGDIPRRGHVAVIHHMASATVRGAQFIGLGRTDKHDAAGLLESNNTLLRIKDRAQEFGTRTEAKTARSNLMGRYSFHFHLTGTMNGIPRVENCYFEDSPGHLVVHHDCEADFHNVAGTEFYGAFMVSEQGSERGTWTRCLALGTSYDGREFNLEIGPKNIAIDRGRVGDNAYTGYGFFNRGRATVNADSYAVSCTHGHVYFPRDDNEVVQPVKNLKRADMPLQTPSLLSNGVFAPVDEWEFVDYPIIGLTDVGAIACGYGIFVTKEAGQQRHDVQVYFKRPRAWGCIDIGMMVEYVGTYLIEDGDFVAGTQGAGSGFLAGVNAYGIGCHRLQTEGWETGFLGLSENTDGWDAFHNADNPRQYNIGHSSVNDTVAEALSGGGSVSLADLDNTAVDLDAEPTDTLPLQITLWDGNNTLSSEVDNTDGTKQDNLSSAADIVVKPNSDPVMKINPGWKCKTWTSSYGYWQYNGDNVALLHFILSDRVTGRHAKVTKIANAQANTPPGSSKGTLTLGSAVTASDITSTTAADTPVTLNVIALSSPSGGDGAAYVIDALDFIPPSHGKMTIDNANEITYMPHPEYSGADFAEVFIESGGRYKTVRVNFLVGGLGSGITPPVAVTHFAARDAAEADTIDLELISPPDVDGRHILYVQYSTDAGVTWRRLCNGWRKNIYKITTESDGTALANGSYNLRIRYKTDYDYVTAPASADAAVTVGA